MKKLLQKIKLRKCKTEVDKEYFNNTDIEHFLVCYEDKTWEEVWFKDDLMYILKNDLKKPVRCVFDMHDRIIVDRDILIDRVIE